MTKRLSLATAALTALAAVLAVVLAVQVPALAAPSDSSHGKATGHAKHQAAARGSSKAASDHDGDADSSSSTSYTEDNDTNDGGTPNNVSDEGDNRHPSGKDRSVEHGNSGNQGKSESHPDDSKGPMRYEGELGPDKPNGPGGTDLADQDGNNGCGNDDDFNDDNNGWCGHKKDESAPEVTDTCTDDMNTATDECGSEVPPVVAGDVEDVCETDSTMGDVTESQCGSTVLGELVHNAGGSTVLGERITASPKFRGATLARKAAGAVLPFTGGSVTIFLIIALGLLGVGAALLVARRN